MNDTKKIETLKGMIFQKRDLEGQKKDLSDSIKVNEDKIEQTIIEDGEIRTCKKLLSQNMTMMVQKKELSGKIKMIVDEMEKMILGEGEYDGQMDIHDVLEREGV